MGNKKIAQVTQGDGSLVSEWLKAAVLFIMLYMVLAFGNFGTEFQYVGF